MAEYRLEISNMTKSFPGVKALSGVQLNVRPGEVHALVGENGAGKSTLMKCIFGIYHPDAGTIKLDGEECSFKNPQEALEGGISMIHQELSPIPYRPVMENIWLNRFPKNGIAIDHKKMIADTQALFDELEIKIDPTALAADLSVSQLQLAEIAKAVSYDSKVIIMDEPTSSLTENETAHLFRIIRKLTAEGRSIIYISHKLEEIMENCDNVTIFRDGCYQGTWPVSELTLDLIIERMVARSMENRFPPRMEQRSGETILKVENLTSAVKNSFHDVSFELKRGEILGIGGLVGAQRTELVESIFGMRPIESGKIIKDGNELKIKIPSDAIKSGIALLTEERRKNGIIGVLSVRENIVLANMKAYCKTFLNILNVKKRKEDALHMTKLLKVKTASQETQCMTLSGGNQQKLLVARWLLTVPDVLIMDEPTRGIDVGAKYEIYCTMQDLAKQGKAIIMISSEMPELLGMSDRVMVMCDGRVTGFLDSKDATDVRVMELATQFEHQYSAKEVQES